MIADFHNDYLTDKDFRKILISYNDSENAIVGAIFKKADYVYTKNLLNEFLKIKKRNLYFAFEDFSYEEDIFNLIHGLLYFNPIYVGLTWNYENNLAYGAYCDGKIKKRGKEVIKALKNRGIYLDVSHLCEKSFYDAFNYTDKIICSHTCFYDLNNHPRNIKYGQIKEIVSSGGIIGLTFYKPFLASRQVADVYDVYKHIDYFVQNFGAENLALGTDFYGCEEFPSGFSDYSFEDILKDYLLKKGYDIDDVERILYRNLSEFLDKRKQF